jgi:hypothetical protein
MVLTSAAGVVKRFWDISEEFSQRRDFVTNLGKQGDTASETARVRAGLAVGYLAVRLLDDALISAAISVSASPDSYLESCCSAVSVLFDERVFRTECLTEYRAELSRRETDV